MKDEKETLRTIVIVMIKKNIIKNKPTVSTTLATRTIISKNNQWCPKWKIKGRAIRLAIR